MRCYRASLFLFLTLCGVFWVSTDANAAQRSVPGSFSSIQAAINASQNGDEIVVSPGTYRENITVDGKYITIRSSADAQSTILAGNPGRTPVMYQNVPFREGARNELAGFTITGGYSPDGQGGGITIANNADPVIRNNVIENNQSTSQGGGVLIYNNSNPHIRNNTIRNNQAFMFGGGIFAVKNSSPSITENYIQNNLATGASIPNGGASGGAIYLENDTANKSSFSSPVVFHNVISGNRADFAGGAISLRVGVNATIEDNDITNNTAPYGGGIHIETEGSSPKVISNRIYSNVAPLSGISAGSGHGGGISVYAQSYPLIADNDVAFNRSSHGGAGLVLAESSSSTITRNKIRSNEVADTNGTFEGGGIYIANAKATITNNLFDGNIARVGGGLALLTGGESNIIHNTIVNNKVSHTYGGGGMFVANGVGISGNILNNIFSLNEKYQIFEDTTKTKIDNNVITNSGSGVYFTYGAGGAMNSTATLNSSVLANANNNTDGNPLFTDSLSGDYSILGGSSAISLAQASSVTDDARLLLRNSPDAGAYEYQDGSLLQKTQVKRFWSQTYRGHFYTLGTTEAYDLIRSKHPKEWAYESTAYDSFSSQVAGSIPVYRFWSQAYKGHFYTIDSSEKTYVESNYPPNIWQYEGVAYYVYPLSATGNTNTVDRFWSNTYNHHFYTANAGESSYVQNNLGQVWSYEGGRFKVPQ